MANSSPLSPAPVPVVESPAFRYLPQIRILPFFSCIILPPPNQNPGSCLCAGISIWANFWSISLIPNSLNWSTC
jgi:hypothetical protein